MTDTRRESPFYNIFFNIALPVIILQQFTKRLDAPNGAIIALFVALAFPFGYGLLDYLRNKKKNYVSLLGLVNILMTGGLALLQLEGFWFAVKEAAFPAILGIGVFWSTFTSKPAMKMLMYNPQVLNISEIETRLQSFGTVGNLQQLLKRSTLLLTVSFAISSLLNFILARVIFTDIDPAMESSARSIVLNEQISKMTWLSFIVIVFPLMIFTGFLVWHLLRGIQKLTGLTFDEILKK